MPSNGLIITQRFAFEVGISACAFIINKYVISSPDNFGVDELALMCYNLILQ